MTALAATQTRDRGAAQSAGATSVTVPAEASEVRGASRAAEADGAPVGSFAVVSGGTAGATGPADELGKVGLGKVVRLGSLVRMFRSG